MRREARAERVARFDAVALLRVRVAAPCSDTRSTRSASVCHCFASIMFLQARAIRARLRAEHAPAGAHARLLRIDAARDQFVAFAQDARADRVQVFGLVVEFGDGLHGGIEEMHEVRERIAEEARHAQRHVDARPVEDRRSAGSRSRSRDGCPPPTSAARRSARAPARCRRRRCASSPCPTPTDRSRADSRRDPADAARSAASRTSDRATRRPASAPRAYRRNRSCGRWAARRDVRATANRSGPAARSALRGRASVAAALAARKHRAVASTSSRSVRARFEHERCHAARRCASLSPRHPAACVASNSRRSRVSP